MPRQCGPTAGTTQQLLSIQRRLAECAAATKSCDPVVGYLGSNAFPGFNAVYAADKPSSRTAGWKLAVENRTLTMVTASFRTDESMIVIQF